jgi:hypothetical protein
MALEQASLIGGNLEHRSRQFEDEEEQMQVEQLLDLDSTDGQQVCRNFLCCIERLIEILKLPT